MLHTLKKAVKDRAIYKKALDGIDELEKIKVTMKKTFFEDQAREFARHNLTDFYKSSSFNKEFAIEGDMIVTKNKV